MKKTLLTLVLTMAAIAGSMAQSITNATFSYSFNGEGSRVSFPESGFSTLDLSETVAENFKIDAITVQTSGPVNDVTMYGAQYKSGDKDPEIIEIPLVAQEAQAGDGTVYWVIPADIFEDNMDNGWIVQNNDRSTATRYLTFYFVANKNKTPAYYNNGGNNYSIRFKTEGKGGGDQSGNITFYDTYTAALTLSMTGGKYSNITYTYAGDGSRDISDQPGEVSSLQISDFTLRLKRASADLEIESVSVQYKVYEEGSNGQWNGMEFTEQEDEGGDILAKKYVGTRATQDLTKGLKQGTSYVLEVIYQVVDKNGNYYFFEPSNWYGKYKFSVNNSGGGGGGGESVRGDLNGDGQVNMEDVMFLVNKILNGKYPDEK
ncbi:MAG: hypothetical protein IKO58_04800 [Prevotella sp.]|nr:hypothetical protein [Prevotella sp.]